MNFRRLRTLMLREVRATFRSTFNVFVMITVPVGALLAFSFILSTEVSDLDLGVLDLSQTAASRRLVADLTAKGTFVAHWFQSRDGLEQAIVAGNISAGIVIPSGFDRGDRVRMGAAPAQLQIIYDGAEAVLAGNAEAFLRSMIAASTGQSLNMAGSDIRRPAAMREAPSLGPGGGVRVVTRALFNPRLDGKPFMVSGTYGFVLSFLAVVMTAVSIVNEKLTGTFEQLQVTPATGLEILLGKILPIGAMFSLDIVLMVLVAGFVVHVWPTGSIIFFVVVSSFYVLVSLALGVIISATSATAAEAVQKSVMLSIPLVQLSGFAFPIHNMPWFVRWIAEVFPATHYIRVARAIYIRGDGPLELAPELLLLTLFGVLLISYALGRIEARA